MPIELLDFSGNTEGGQNHLFWQSASEINAQLYDIQRFAANNDFQTIGKIKAIGKPSAYNFTDEKPLSGINHYRLKMVDWDGKTMKARKSYSMYAIILRVHFY